MRTEDASYPTPAGWAQLEETVDRLHAAARTLTAASDFYQQLVHESLESLAASGAAAWRLLSSGRPELTASSLVDRAESKRLGNPAHLARIANAFAAPDAAIISGDAEQALGDAHDILLCPVIVDHQPAQTDSAGAARQRVYAVIELWLPADASRTIRQAWLNVAQTLADVAADFHLRDELRRLHETTAVERQIVALVHRVQQSPSLNVAAMENVNELRRILPCDRVSLVLRRGARWRLAAVSSVDQPNPRTDFALRSELLARHAALWGEPFDYCTGSSTLNDNAGSLELPPRLSDAVEEYVDHSHARRLAVAPISFDAPHIGTDEPVNSPARRRFDAVLIAEQFDAAGDSELSRQLVHLGQLSGPGLGRAVELDRFPVRMLLRFARPFANWSLGRRVRVLAMTAAVAGAVGALALTPADLTIDAPAFLEAAVERDVFASATGAVDAVHVRHAEFVKKGQPLVTLRDPELSLKLQEVAGEIDAVTKRLEAIAVGRTERTLREDPGGELLSMSAEQRELEERLVGLKLQHGLLSSRQEALILRSPINGQVLTRDVQSVLESRPVERGQILLTVANSSNGWQLRAQVEQRDIGFVLKASEEHDQPLTVEYRLAGDVIQSYTGRLTSISAAAPLDADGLQAEAPPVDVCISLDGTVPAAARSGMTASVRIHCGTRSLGFVWLHDAAATIYRWVTF